MRFLRIIAWSLAISVVPTWSFASSHHGGGGDGGSPHTHHGSGGGGSGPRQHPGGIPLGVGGGWAWYGFPYYGIGGPNGPMYFTPPRPIVTPLIVPVVVAPERNVLAGPMPTGPVAAGLGVPVKRAKLTDPGRSAQLVTFGDRLFRAGNIRRAADRYEQAMKANPDAAAPRVRLAQVALARGQFAEAARQIRDGIAVEPEFLANARDIQAIYAEPADFLRQIGRLESHVQVDPSDRDAWLVLGTELYLSGQTRRASDIFVRLTDRKPDPALSALLDAASPPVKK